MSRTNVMSYTFALLSAVCFASSIAVLTGGKDVA